MKRKKNWPGRLVKAIETVQDQPFLWGRHDCCCFASFCVEAMTGQNPMKDFKGKYKDEKEALEALKVIGSGTLLETLKGIFGRPVSPHYAQRGDVVYTVFETGPSVGICLGKDSFFVGEDPNKEGLVSFPTREMAKVFKI